jgi:hypothetical protein
MLWLLIVMIVSVCGLLLAAGGLALHIRRQHRKLPAPGSAKGRSLHEESEN